MAPNEASAHGSISAPAVDADMPSTPCRYSMASRLTPMKTPGTSRYMSMETRSSGSAARRRFSSGVALRKAPRT